jgi:eukaryotic-like serine/threonine-protein kinase
MVSAALGSLTLNMLYAKKFAEAEPLAREALAIHERLHPNDWFRFSNQSVVGACLLGQKKYAQAEPFLAAGYQGMKQRYDDFIAGYKSRDLKLALSRLIQLYEETDQPAKAAEWKQELADFEKHSRHE